MARAPAPRRLSLEDYVAGVRACDRSVIARAITLIESTRGEHQALAGEVLQRLLPFTGDCTRVGITGVPGVGKSTLIDRLGTRLTAAGHKLAVLAVDPSSSRSGGSILGDKTRMAALSQDPAAFIRPSPSSGTLGGVARKTRETMWVLEAAGFDVVLVETVGVGQSETMVAEMVDFFLVLMLPGAGDELQGLKRGLLELADLIVVNKAEGANRQRALQAAAEYQAALNIVTPVSPSWRPAVRLASGLADEGLDDLWADIGEHRKRLSASGERAARRSEQAVRWMHAMLDDRLRQLVSGDKRLAARMPAIERDVRAGRLTPPKAVETVLGLIGLGGSEPV